jgi:hypothetical protein
MELADLLRDAFRGRAGSGKQASRISGEAGSINNDLSFKQAAV